MANNTANGALSGSMQGASAGASAGGGWGALAGGIGGGVVGALNGMVADDEERAKKKALQRIQNRWENEADSILSDMANGQIRMSDSGDLETYKNLRNNYNPADYVISDDALGSLKQSFNKDDYKVEDYLVSNRDAILQDIGKNVMHTAAGSALGHSSGTLANVVQQEMAKDEQLQKDARQAMNEDRNFDYGMYTTYLAQKQQQLNQLQQGNLAKMNMLGEDVKFDQEQNDTYNQNRLALANAKAQMKVQMV